MSFVIKKPLPFIKVTALSNPYTTDIILNTISKKKDKQGNDQSLELYVCHVSNKPPKQLPFLREFIVTILFDTSSLRNNFHAPLSPITYTWFDVLSFPVQ